MINCKLKESISNKLLNSVSISVTERKYKRISGMDLRIDVLNLLKVRVI